MTIGKVRRSLPIEVQQTRREQCRGAGIPGTYRVGVERSRITNDRAKKAWDTKRAKAKKKGNK